MKRNYMKHYKVVVLGDFEREEISQDMMADDLQAYAI